jgi:transposase
LVEFKLSHKERIVLESHITRTKDAIELRRMLALLWLDAGVSIAEIAKRLYVTPKTIYNWVLRFQERKKMEIELRIADDARSGRPSTIKGIIEPIIEKIINDDPRDYGYQSTIWTVSIIKDYLLKKYQINASERSISYAIERLEILWKRPRHTLALREIYWRQAKGG